MTANLSPSGPGSVATFHVTNDGTERVALRFRVLTRSMGADGKEVNAPEETAFVLYPSRVLLEPGMSAAVKIQWRGADRIEREACYRFVAEEVPVDSAQRTESGLRVLFRYIASVYVVTQSFSPKLSVEVRPSVDSHGGKGFSVKISNGGTRHVVANNVSVTLSFADGGTYAISAAELGKLNGANYLPGGERHGFVPKPVTCPDGEFEAGLAYESEY
jgi:fimbrial chaperone protein